MITIGIIASPAAPPPPPTGLSISSITSSGFILSWVAPLTYLSISYYNIYLNGSFAGTSSTLSYTFTGLNSNTAYSVSVSAADTSGNTSIISSSISATTLPIQPTAQVYSINFSSTNKSATVTYGSTTLSFQLTPTTTGSATIVINKNGTDIGQYPDTMTANTQYLGSYTLSVAATYGDVYKINITYI